MFEKWRIKVDMEVTDATGRHVGTVTGVDGDLITLARSDSAEGRYQQIDISYVERITGNRVELKEDAVLPADVAPTGTVADEPHPNVEASVAPSVEATGYAGIRRTMSDTGTREDAQLFGTSGLGTGMGGSGTP